MADGATIDTAPALFVPQYKHLHPAHKMSEVSVLLRKKYPGFPKTIFDIDAYPQTAVNPYPPRESFFHINRMQFRNRFLVLLSHLI